MSPLSCRIAAIQLNRCNSFMPLCRWLHRCCRVCYSYVLLHCLHFLHFHIPALPSVAAHPLLKYLPHRSSSFDYFVKHGVICIVFVNRVTRNRSGELLLVCMEHICIDVDAIYYLYSRYTTAAWSPPPTPAPAGPPCVDDEYLSSPLVWLNELGNFVSN